MKVKNYALVLLYLFFGSQMVLAQEKTITGTITTESDGMPLPGANVIVKNTSRGVQSRILMVNFPSLQQREIS